MKTKANGINGLPASVIRNNITFLTLLNKEIFEDKNHGIKQMVKDMKQGLKVKK